MSDDGYHLQLNIVEGHHRARYAASFAAPSDLAVHLRSFADAIEGKGELLEPLPTILVKKTLAAKGRRSKE